MDEEYRWDDHSYTAIAANQVAWQDVSYVLRHAHPKIRQHTGAVLQVIARATDQRILVATLIEETDDHYLVVTARHLTGEELTRAEAILNRGQTMNRDQAIEAAKQPIDWTDATVDTTARKATMVYSTRLPDDLATWLEDEATRRGINPSAALRELVADAKRTAEQDKTVTVRLSELHQVINQIADRAA